MRHPAWRPALGLALAAIAAPMVHRPAILSAEEPRKPFVVHSLFSAPSAPALSQAGEPAAAGELARRLREAHAAALSATAAGPRPQAAALAERVGKDVRIVWRPGVGTPAQIRGAALEKRAPAAIGEDADLLTSRSFFRRNRTLLGIADPDAELALSTRVPDALGLSHLKFGQRHRGLPVWPADVIVHLDREGSVYLVDGAFVPSPTLPTLRPVVDGKAAARKALSTASSKARAGTPELIVYAPGKKRPRLAWKVEISGRIEEAAFVVVDALTGARIATVPRVMTDNVAGSGVNLAGNSVPLNVWRSGGQFSLIDTSKPMFDPTSQIPDPDHSKGAIFILDADNTPPNDDPDEDQATKTQVTSSSAGQWAPPDAVSAAFNFGQVFDYYKQTHNRNSIDGEGGNILAVVRLGDNFFNAFWTDSIGGMFFGDADTFAGSLDVVGHEMTHGVTSHTAGLVYQDQAGALNEAISDVFGEMVEKFLVGSNDWAIGTDLSQPLRDMSDPGRFNDPATMSEYVQTDSDSGGVHTNSSIINHAYYLLADGEDGAIGTHDAERIFYRMLTVHLSQNSQFLDARLGAIQAADELFGAGSNQSNRTAQAFDEVEILDAAPAPPPPDVPPVAGGDSAVLIYRDGSLFLGRRETALGDPSQGANLSSFAAAFERPAVSGDGSLAFFVTEDNDACFIPTNGSAPEACLDLPGQIASVAMSRDANRYAFVLLDNGERENKIAVIDLTADSAVQYDLLTPATDGGYANTVLFADTLEFTANQRFLFYDALSQITLSDGSTAGAWSVSAIDFSGGQTYTLVPPFAGVDIANPAVAKTSDDFYTFEVDDQDTGKADIYTARLSTGEFVQTVVGVGASGPAPSYTGDDRALVYAYPDDSAATGSSLATIALGADRLHAAGSPATYLFDGAYGVIYRRGGYTPPQGNCAPNATTLCLSNGRFQVQATFTTSAGSQGIAQAKTLTADTGYFTFFNPNNVEVVIKVLNACAVNHHSWVFAGGLTDVATVLTVTDTLTGVTRTYANPQHTPFQPVQDTQAFSTCFAGAAGVVEDELPADESVKAAWDAVQYALEQANAGSLGEAAEAEPVEEAVLAPRATDACIPEDTTLCLTGGRFRVQVAYRTTDGRSGSGHAVGITSDTGYFWFLTPSNVEMVVKVLNACSIGQRYWIFAGGLTNVDVTTTVTDTQTNTVRTYHNTLGKKFQPIQDTGAFKTCP